MPRARAKGLSGEQACVSALDLRLTPARRHQSPPPGGGTRERELGGTGPRRRPVGDDDGVRGREEPRRLLVRHVAVAKLDPILQP